MTYSKKRLAMMAFLFGALFIVHPPSVDVVPEGATVMAGHYCNSPPCEFPAEHGEGGIIFGVNRIEATNVHYNPTDIPKQVSNANRDEPTLEIGLDDINPQQFFLYKGWEYYDSNTFEYANSYVWINSTNAIQLDEGGFEADGSCGGTDDCDLIAQASEVGARRLQGTDPNFGFSININEWGTDPEDDDGCTSITLNAAGCFNTPIEIDDGIFRVHNISAGGHPNANENERLRLRNVYAEIRYGTGQDRAYGEIPDSDRPGCCGTNDNSEWSAPYYESPFALAQTCDGFSKDCSTHNSAQGDNGDYDVGLDVGEVYSTGVTSDSGNFDFIQYAKPLTYEKDIVIAGPMTQRGGQSAHPRVQTGASGCCGGNEFKISTEEWDFLNGDHLTEKTGYVAFETSPIDGDGSGSNGDVKTFDLNNDGDVDTQVGSTDSRSVGTSDTQVCKLDDYVYEGKPVVFVQAQTLNGDQAIWQEVDNIGNAGCGPGYDGFDARIFDLESDGSQDFHADERIGFVAFDIAEFGDGVRNRQFINNFPQFGEQSLEMLPQVYRDFEVGRAGPISDNWEKINFGGSYDDPVFIARTQRGGAPDTKDGHLRYRNLNGDSVEVRFQEPNDAAHDSNGGSDVAYFVFDNSDRYNGVLGGGIANPNPRPIQRPGGQDDF